MTAIWASLAIVWTTGTAQPLSLKFGTPFRRADLVIRWDVQTNVLPLRVWMYRLLPNRFSSNALGYLIALGGFSDQDLKRSNADEILYIKPGQLPNLFVSFRFGQIRYQTRSPSYTNSPRHLPVMAHIPELTSNFFRIVAIDPGDLQKRYNGSWLGCWEPSTEYFVSNRIITNIEFRAADFRREVDGGTWVGAETGGDGQLQFGDYGKPSRIWLSWRKLQRAKQYSTVAPSVIMQWIREGKAVQNMISMNDYPIDWQTVRSLTVTKARLCYYAGGPFDPSDWLVPFVALWTTVERDRGKIDVEIDCPIYDPKGSLPEQK